ncbi:MAG: efflux RND transporter periplasmic adaptor subunit [Thiovulaceae bacterium]|nr:efflux RND transporter periplasmic adaptor subunit [Sulfurimonadaceae bacterium]
MRKLLSILVILFVNVQAENIYATFNVTPAKSADVAFYANGVVDKLYVDINSHVKKGQKLGALQNNDLQASLEMAKASLKDAKIAFEFSKRDYEREQKVQHLVDEATFDRFRQAYERATAGVVNAQANVKYKQSLVDNSVLYAPFDGVITDKKVEVGDVVSSMMLKTAFTVQSSSSRKLLLEFDQTNWKKVKLGDIFRYKIDGDTKEHIGKISKIYSVSNSANRKMKAEVIANDIMVGLYGDGNIITK